MKRFLGLTQVVIPNGISIGSAVFAQLPLEFPYTLQLAATFPSKIAHFRGYAPHLIVVTWAHPPQALNGKFSAVWRYDRFSLSRVAYEHDQQIDRQTHRRLTSLLSL